MSDGTAPFLVGYDYGQGGLWWWMTARSRDEITDTYHHVRVYERVPEWWTEDQDRITPRVHVNEPDAALIDLLKVR